MTPAVSPCIHPTCDDGTGNPALTTQTMCDRCRRHFRRELDWLVLDYVTIKATLPKPTATQRVGGSSSGKPSQRSFGHPAEWASDRCTEVAGLLNDAEDQLRAARNEGPALFVCPESTKVASAHRYLTDRWDQFCTFDNADEFADAIHETHRVLRNALGQSRGGVKLPVPCPTCDVASLVQAAGQITCAGCHRVIREADYGLFTRIAVDYLIDEYDTQKAAELA